MGNYFDTVKNEGYVDGQLYRDHNEWRRAMAAKGYSEGGGGGGVGSYPAFTFDWSAARSQAMDQLTPYYTQKLNDAKGDVELAKRYIEEDYQKGVRRSTEDYNRTITQNQQDLTSGLQGNALTETDETRAARAGANQRGTLLGEMDPNQTGTMAPYSDYANQYILGPLNQRQMLRKQAIERSINRQSELAGISNTRTQQDFTTGQQRGLTAQDRGFLQTQQELEEEKRNRAVNELAPQSYQEALTKYRAVNNIPT